MRLRRRPRNLLGLPHHAFPSASLSLPASPAARRGGSASSPSQERRNSGAARRVARDEAGGATVTIKKLVVRSIDAPASAVVEHRDGVAVVPNFKRFRKAGAPAGTNERRRPLPPPLVTSKWVQPGSHEFAAEEDRRKHQEREADELFHAYIKPVKGQPLPDPDDAEDSRAPGAVRVTAAAKPPRARPTEAGKGAAGSGGSGPAPANVEALAREGNLKRLKVPELKQYLAAKSLPVSGRKDDLIARITRHLS